MLDAIAAIRLISADAEALAGFYINALGFARARDEAATDAFCGPLRRRLVLCLGAQRLEIAQPMQPHATDIPPASPAPSLAFQHFAMVAPAMSTAVARLETATGWTPITQGGPQTLPAASGGVTAFKFRDPEGHPLEFLTFPPHATPPAWQGRAGVLVGIDHTAIVVGDTARSLAFYAGLGFRRSGGSLNRGPEQAALDGVPDPLVEVTALGFPSAPPPHLELLCYKKASLPDGVADSDRLATRTVCAGGDLAIRDPDGHRCVVRAGLQADRREHDARYAGRSL